MSMMNQSTAIATTSEEPQRKLVPAKRKSVYKRTKKPADMPQRPLSAYNLYFRRTKQIIVEERTRQLRLEAQQAGRPAPKRAKIALEELARLIAKRWSCIEPKELQVFQAMAERDALRYKKEMDEYYQKVATTMREKHQEVRLSKSSHHSEDSSVVPFAEGAAPPPATQNGVRGESSLNPPVVLPPVSSDNHLPQGKNALGAGIVGAQCCCCCCCCCGQKLPSLKEGPQTSLLSNLTDSTTSPPHARSVSLSSSSSSSQAPAPNNLPIEANAGTAVAPHSLNGPREQSIVSLLSECFDYDIDGGDTIFSSHSSLTEPYPLECGDLFGSFDF